MRRTTRHAAAAALAVGILLSGCADDGAETGDVVEAPETGEMVEDLEGVDPTMDATMEPTMESTDG